MSKQTRKSVGIVAGTKVDTQMGVDYFRDQGIAAFGSELSLEASENNKLQVLDREGLQKLVSEKFRFLNNSHKLDSFCIYCNSVSTALDLISLRQELRLPVITPLETYELIASKYNRFGLLTANCQSAAGIEKVITQVNNNAEVIGMGMLPLVTAIENKKGPEEIVKELGLNNLMNIFKKVEAEVIILGCTHFPYIKEVIRGISPIQIFDPSKEMVNRALS